MHPKILASIVNQTVEISGQKCTALFVAALKNYADIVQELIMFPGLDLNAKNQNAQLTALCVSRTTIATATTIGMFFAPDSAF